MNSKYNRKVLDAEFFEKVTVVNMEKEYPGHTENVKYALFTDIPEEELKEKYPEEMKHYSPYVMCRMELMDAFRCYQANDSKYAWRESADEKKAVEHAANISAPYEPFTLAEQDAIEIEERETIWRLSMIKVFREVYSELTEIQRNRLEKYYLDEKIFVEIAAEENYSNVAVRNSIRLAEKKIRKDFFEKVVTFQGEFQFSKVNSGETEKNQTFLDKYIEKIHIV